MHQLIMFDGISTVGKSTTSKSVYQQLSHQFKCIWLHEECADHPLRIDEFEAGDIHTIDGMESNRVDMLNRWRNLVDMISSSDSIYCMEGCFLHSISRYLLESVWNQEQIIEFCKEIIAILKPLNPMVVFLYKTKLKESYQKAFLARGDWWRDLILSKPEPYGYFETHAYEGDQSIYEDALYCQQAMRDVYEELDCDKMSIDTSEELWDAYVSEVMNTLGYSYEKKNQEVPDYHKYCGAYGKDPNDAFWKISYDQERKEFYTSLFWPYMPMRYLGSDVFELISFPVRLEFDFSKEKTFRIIGNYDWDLNNAILTCFSEQELQ